MERRLRQAVTLYVFAALGLFLLVAPWTVIWEHAVAAWMPEGLAGWMRSGWIRGGVSGVGLLDVVMALQVGLELHRRPLLQKEKAAAGPPAEQRSDEKGGEERRGDRTL